MCCIVSKLNNEIKEEDILYTTNSKWKIDEDDIILTGKHMNESWSTIAAKIDCTISDCKQRWQFLKQYESTDIVETKKRQRQRQRKRKRNCDNTGSNKNKKQKKEIINLISDDENNNPDDEIKIKQEKIEMCNCNEYLEFKQWQEFRKLKLKSTSIKFAGGDGL